MILSWEALLAFFIGGLYGIFFGSIPGLTATLAVALFVPFAFFLDPAVALPAIIAIAAVAIFAGDVASAVARIPGTPASAAYVEELHELSRERGPLQVLGIAALGSAFGGVVGTILLILAATGLATIARMFTSVEYFWIAVLGLTAGIFATGGAPAKAFLALLLGMIFSTVGIDITLGYPRFHFDNPNLLGGLDYIVAMIGLFGFSEVLEHLYRRHMPVPRQDLPDAGMDQSFFRAPFRLLLGNKWLALRSSLLGTFVGFLPGAGADIAAWISSSLQKMVDGQREKVILAATTSNNAGVAGAWVPALSLGIPGDTITAIVLGVFLMKGITPGPQLFQEQMPLIWTMYLTFLGANLLLLPLLGYAIARVVAVIVKVPLNLLLGIIAALCVVGAYAINNNPFDVWVMIFMGLVGFSLRRGGFPLAPVVLGMVLGPIVELNFMISLIKTRWDMMVLFERPVAVILMLATFAVILLGIRLYRKRGEETAE